MNGRSFDNSHKETKEALEWFIRNLDVKGDVLYWKVDPSAPRRRGSYLVGKPAGCVSVRGYIQVRKGKDKFMAHRILWGLHYGEWPKYGIDHINGDRLDNRIENMRVTTQYGNCKNSAKYPRKEPWIATGVMRSRGGMWTAYAQVNKRNIHIGQFKCHTSAMIARKLFDQSNGFSDRHGAEERVY